MVESELELRSPRAVSVVPTNILLEYGKGRGCREMGLQEGGEHQGCGGGRGEAMDLLPGCFKAKVVHSTAQ